MTFQSSRDCITENKLRKIYQSHVFFCFFVLCEFTSRKNQNMGDQEASTAYFIAYMKTNKLLLQSYVSHLETTEEHENPSVISIGDVPGMLPKWCIMSWCFSGFAAFGSNYIFQCPKEPENPPFLVPCRWLDISLWATGLPSSRAIPIHPGLMFPMEVSSCPFLARF